MAKYINDKRHTIILVVLILVVILMFTGIILWPSTLRNVFMSGKPTPLVPPTVTPTPTALPTTFPVVIDDYFENQNGTNGLLIGSVILVAIILIGVLISIKNNEK